METINHLMNFAHTIFARLALQTTPIDSLVLATSVIALSVLLTAPGRVAQVFGTLALAMLGFLLLFAPGYAMFLFVLGCGAVGVLRSRKRFANLQKQVDNLSRVVHELELAENRRLIQLLNSSPASQEEAPSILPSEAIQGAAPASEFQNVKSLHRA